MTDKLFTLIHNDDHIIVVSKAHGLHVIPDRYGKESLVLINILKELYGKVIPVHRLDAGTGGLIIFAKNEKAHKFLCNQFENRLVKKTYLALTKGSVLPQTLMLPIAKGNHGKFKINFKSGKPAVTSFIPLKTDGNVSLVQATLYPGRTHQIRVHLKALKAPLYQDWLYNNPCDDRRLTLFAKKIAFTHPATNKEITLVAPLSDFMATKADLLGLSAKSMI